MKPNNISTINFDVIIVGGGHAGIEAAYAAARLGSKTALVTLNIEKIGLMPCNPSIGGVGKGHIVFEIAALGGMMPQLCSTTYLQARMLNTRKGAAVQGLRLQIDKHAYSKQARERLAEIENLSLVAAKVNQVKLDTNKQVQGVICDDGTILYAPTVVLTTGTFLNGRIHIGAKSYDAGRQGEEGVTSLSKFLKSTGLAMGRLKTGTPPRLLHSSIDFSKLEQQKTEPIDYLFEFYPHTTIKNIRDCFIAHTNENTHDIIKKNHHLSAVHNGNITGTAPRYCPSIEDKVSRFPDKTAHHIFVEPEDATGKEIYPSGISCSLPEHVQQEYINSIIGFENAIITKPGYAIEYDFVYPNQLKATLEIKSINGLFLAGQINGTTGYEEAAGQGIIAGINAHLKQTNQDPFIVSRNESYIGVMIDDLVTMSVDEPYRMFTSRAERRLTLRQDNAFLRLMPTAYKLGLINENLYQDFCTEKNIIDKALENIRANHSNAEALRMFGKVRCDNVALQKYIGTDVSSRAVATIYAEIKYEPYLAREEIEIKRTKQHRNTLIPATLNYEDVSGLSKELQEKLKRYKPETIAQAALIPGMTPAAISLLIFKVRMYKKTGNYATYPSK